MKTVIIDGVKFQTILDKEIRGRLTYDIKVVTLRSTQDGTQYFVWSNIPNFELSGIKMDIWELNSYELIIKMHNYVEMQKFFPVKKSPDNKTSVMITKYVRIKKS